MATMDEEDRDARFMLENEEFASQIEDEDASIYPEPGVELGMDLARDFGSGSRAMCGPEEILGERMSSGIGYGPASEDGQSEIGSYAENGPSEIGSYAEYGPSEVGAELADEEALRRTENALRALRGAGSLGYAAAAEDGQSEIGAYPEDGASEIGAYPEDGASEIGSYAEYGPSEVGASAAEEGQSEIGYDEYPTEGVEDDLEDEARGAFDHNDELDYAAYPEDGATEIGVAVAKVVKKAKEKRVPAPPMDAVEVDAPTGSVDEDWGLSDVVLGVDEAAGANLFPLTTELMKRAGSMTEPRIVRIDTDESYQQFRQENSDELRALRERLEEHIADTAAHGGDVADFSDDIEEGMTDLVEMGAEVQAVEQAKLVNFVAPKKAKGHLTTWKEKDMVCASMRLPNGKIATTMEPAENGIEEMAEYADEAEVPAGWIVGCLAEIGCVGAAGTAVKELAAATPSLNALTKKKKGPCVVRIQPSTNPAISALAQLAMMCHMGNAQACAEMKALGEVAPGPLKLAMQEAVALAQKAMG